MHIGLTYDLRSEYLAAGYSDEETAEFDQQGTIDAVAGAIETLGHDVDRIGSARSLVNRLARGDRWDLVFNIAEGLAGYGREAQVPAILDVYGIAYTFAEPLAASVCLHKGWSKLIVHAAGIPTAEFVVLESAAHARRVVLPFPLLAKPVAEGTGKGVTPKSIVNSHSELESLAAGLIDRYQQPVLVETFLPGANLPWASSAPVLCRVRSARSKSSEQMPNPTYFRTRTRKRVSRSSNTARDVRRPARRRIERIAREA
jgi:D-alanine-D-alanine ligase